jgi:hypothetical protein
LFHSIIALLSFSLLLSTSYCLREKTSDLFEHPDTIGQLKLLLDKNIDTIQHRLLPGKNVDNQNIFFCRYVYDNRAKRILKNPSLINPNTNVIMPVTGTMAAMATKTTATTTMTTTTTTNTTTTISVPTAARM